MKRKEDIRKELEELSPFLAKLKKEKDGFEVPVDYFQGLSDQIMDRIKAEEQPAPQASPATPAWVTQVKQAIQWLVQPQYALAIASVAILLVAGWWWNQSNTLRPSSDALFAELSQEDILNYIDQNIENFGTELVTAVEQSPGTQDILPAVPLEEEAVEEYLDEILNELNDEELEELL
jgi:hypothetical protein